MKIGLSKIYRKKVIPIVAIIIFFNIVSGFDIVTLNSKAQKENLETYVYKNIINNTVWTKENSPFIITYDNNRYGINIEENATLTIEPGVTIKFEKAVDSRAGVNLVSLYIRGTLIAIGTDKEPILFTSNETDPEPGDWGAISFSNTNSQVKSRIEFCIIEYSGSGISCKSSSLKISNNIIRNNYGGIYCDRNSNPLIENNTIYGGITLYINCDPIIINNTIIGSKRCGIDISGSVPNIINTTIINFKNGIECLQADPILINTTIIDCITAINCSGSSPIINDSIISNSSQYDLWMKADSHPIINNSQVDRDKICITDSRSTVMINENEFNQENIEESDEDDDDNNSISSFQLNLVVLVFIIILIVVIFKDRDCRKTT